MSRFKNTYDCPFQRRTRPGDLKKFNVSTLVIHGDNDQIVRIETIDIATAKIIHNAKLLIERAGGFHSITLQALIKTPNRIFFNF